MHALFEDGGKFLAGRLMSEESTSAQVELESGKRVKVKTANLLLKFDQPAPAELLARAQALGEQIDLDLAWTFAPEGEFGFADLAREYFDAKAGVVQQAAALLCLFDAPHYFRRLGKGQFRKAPEETVKAALLGIERKKQVAAQIEDWSAQLQAGECPAPVREQLYKILFKPDKNAAEYKAVVEAARQSHRAPLDLLTAAGAIRSPYQFHWKRFLFEQFPRGAGFPAGLQAPQIDEALALAPCPAFSIDDSATTEIDDALSVQGLGSGTVTLGVHIAAPALAFAPGSAVDRVAAERLSTVYMPGWKMTMLPDAVVQAYTLIERRVCPAVSLYLTIDEVSLEVRASETRLDRVAIVANLRHDQLDASVTEDALEGRAPSDYPFAPELAFLFRLARSLKAQREQVRGKPENFNRPDYNFRLRTQDGSDPVGEPRGDEAVQITTRRRGAPLDLIVAESMILSNSTWGAWLAACGVPGIYRSQASMAPGVKVRMGIKPAPHAGMGVAQYTWATSPLRRYVDLVNQWQIVACVRHGRSAALAAPFKPRDAQLFSIISAFDAAYGAYADFQHGIERYWTLQWLQQQGITELDASVMKDGLVRAETLPLVFKALGCEALPRGSRVRVRITGTDLLTLEVHANLVARLDDAARDGLAAEAGNDAESEADDELAAAEAAAPLALAIDLGATEGASEGGSESAAESAAA